MNAIEGPSGTIWNASVVAAVCVDARDPARIVVKLTHAGKLEREWFPDQGQAERWALKFKAAWNLEGYR